MIERDGGWPDVLGRMYLFAKPGAKIQKKVSTMPGV
jgi:hypothetical protein